MKTQKNLSIETLRGITVLLVVISHVIGSTPDGGMNVDFPHPLRYLYVSMLSFKMPLFTAMAGWVYALRPYSASLDFGVFARRKALRLLVPLVTVGTLYFLIQYFAPGTNSKGDLSQIWKIYVFPYTFYWYLPSLFLMIMFQALIDRNRWMENINQWVMWCLILIAVGVVNDMGYIRDVPNIFSFKGALLQLPYFFVGVAVNRFTSLYQIRGSRWIMWISVVIVVIMTIFICLYPENAVVISMFFPIVMIPVLFLLLSMKWHNRFFTWVAGYAYSIYLFHGFGTSGGRILLKILGVTAMAPIFIFSSLIASVCPILVDKVVGKFKWGRVLFLGKNA